MKMKRCIAEFEEYLLTDRHGEKDKYICSKQQFRQFLQTLPLTKNKRKNAINLVCNSTPDSLIVSGRWIILSRCYASGMDKLNAVVKDNVSEKLGYVLDKMEERLCVAEMTAIKGLSSVLDIQVKERPIVIVCEQNGRQLEVDVKMHHYLLLEGLQDIISCLKNSGESSLEGLYQLVTTQTSNNALSKVGSDVLSFEETIQSYPLIFKLDEDRLSLQESPKISYSLIQSDAQSAISKLLKLISNPIPYSLPTLHSCSISALTGAESLAIGKDLKTFKTVLKTLPALKVLRPSKLVVAGDESEGAVSPLTSALAKFKDLVTKEDRGEGCHIKLLVNYAQENFSTPECEAIGPRTKILKKILRSFPDQFRIKQRVMVHNVAPGTRVRNKDHAQTEACPVANQRDLDSEMGEIPVSTSQQWSDDNEDTESDEELDSSDSSGSFSLETVTDDEVVSVGSETISDSHSVSETQSDDDDRTDLETASALSDDGSVVTVLQDGNYFCQLVKERVSRSQMPVLAVSAQAGWLLVSLWEEHTFAIELCQLSATSTHQSSQENRIQDLLCNKSALKVTFDVSKMSQEIHGSVGLRVTNVCDLKIAHNHIPSKSKEKLATLADMLKAYDLEASMDVDVCMGTIFSPMAEGQAYEEGTISMLKGAGGRLMKVPRLYQKLLGLLPSRQISEVFRLSENAVQPQVRVPANGNAPNSSSSKISSAAAQSGDRGQPISDRHVTSTSEEPNELPTSTSSGQAESCIGQNVEELRHPGSGASSPDPGGPGDLPVDDPGQKGVHRGSSPVSQGPRVLHYTPEGKVTLIPVDSKQASSAINPCRVSLELASEFQTQVRQDVEKFLESFGICIKYALKRLAEDDCRCSLDLLAQVIMDVGRKPSARYYQPTNPSQMLVKTLDETLLTKKDLGDFLDDHCSPVTSDHSASITGTLHRVGVISNRLNEPIGLTASTKYAVLGCTTPLFDLMTQGQSILFVGFPGVGKSTILRDASRVVNDVIGRRMVIIDTYNEIAGDSDIPHHSVGGARRMQLPSRDSQPSIIREAVQNHSPQTMIVDEISTEADAEAILGIRQRGLQVIAAARGQTIADVIRNPLLAPIVGGVRSVILSEKEARQRGMRETSALQRSQPAAFDILVEMRSRHGWIVHANLTKSIDSCLLREAFAVQERNVVMRQSQGCKDGAEFPQVIVTETASTYLL